MRRRAAALLLLVPLLASPATADEDPEAVVLRLHAKLVEVAAQAEQLGFGRRKAALLPIVSESFDVERMLTERVGSSVRLTPAQRSVLVGKLTSLTAQGYASRLDKTTRIRFETGVSTGSADGSVFRVTATRIDGDGSRHSIQYRLRKEAARFLIVNRVEDGRDPVRAERREFEQLWSRGGYPTLLAGLEAKQKPATAPPRTATATQVVARLQDTLLAVMREARQLGYRGRHQRLDPVVRETHYLPAIARLTVRRHWGKWSKAQQREFADTFAKLSVANYASKFDGYAGETFARVEEKQVGKSTVVRSVLTKSNGEKIRFDYTMRKVKGRWRILNITVDGVSDLSTKQAEYGAVLSGGGLPALLQKLRGQIRRYEGADR